MPSPSRLIALVLSALVVLPLLGTPAAAQGAPPVVGGAPLGPADGDLAATIRRTSYGIPHVVARDWASLGFGHGYATAEDSPCNLADTLVTARGERSRYFGPEATYDDQVTLRATNLQVDALVRSLRQREVVEALLADPVRGPSDRAKALVDGYVAGVNRRLEEIGGADGITDPTCRGGDWVAPGTSLDLWYGVYLANLLASSGVFVPQIVGATPPTPDDPGLPVDPGIIGIPFPPGQQPTADEVAAALQTLDPADVDRDALLRGLGRDPERTFGSNGTALGRDVTTTGRGMVLGNPHFPWRGRYSFHQAQLTIPGVYDVGGAALHGSPVINIGFTPDVAWTHTVSTAYRFTPYQYRLVPGSPDTIVTEAGPAALERDVVMVPALAEDGTVEEILEDVYRTPEGFVLEAPEIFLGWTYESVWAIRDANAEHLKTIDVFLEMAEAEDVAGIAAAEDRTAGIPWVNTMAADRDGDVLYADNSVVPNVTDEQVQECATPVGQVLFELAGLPGLDGTRAAGACAWGTDEDASRPGIFGPANLPDTTRTDWVINANDSYWLPNPAEPLEGFDRIIGCEQCERTLRTRVVYRSVLDRLDGTDGLDGIGGSPGVNRFTHEQLQAIQTENRVFAAELAREDDDLQDVCTASGVRQEACDVLAAWSGRDDVDAEGAILFREFWLRGGGVWEVPFDAADPVNTPRDLDEADEGVIQAMVDAVAALDEAGIPLDAPLGDEQVAGDNGPLSAGIPVQGGPAGTGNANVVSAGQVEGIDARYPIIYGSSHIQAVAFTDEGVDAATILTYGNSDDPTNPQATDQTDLWSGEEWVDWAFTPEEQLADPAITAYLVGSAIERTEVDPATTVDEVPDAEGVIRVSGDDRIATAVAISTRTFESADAVVVATAGDFPDALAGGPLAAQLGGPLLITGADGLDPRVAEEIRRLGATRAVLLGGTAALSPQVEADLAALVPTVERIAGDSRFATAALVAERIDSDLVFLASGQGFPDAVAASGVAAALGAPIVLTATDELPDVSAAALEGRTGIVVAGGPVAVSDRIVDGLGSRAVRAAGDSRYGTAAALLREGLRRGLDPDTVWLAAGGTFPDALAAGAAAGAAGTGVLLVDPGAADAAAGLIAELSPSTVLVAGGVNAVSDATVADAIGSAAGG